MNFPKQNPSNAPTAGIREINFFSPFDTNHLVSSTSPSTIYPARISKIETPFESAYATETISPTIAIARAIFPIRDLILDHFLLRDCSACAEKWRLGYRDGQCQV